MPLRPPDDLVERFRQSLSTLVGTEAERSALIAVAVSGGPDSMAMLLLAAAALPGRIVAATVDHRFRPESADEAQGVATLCAALRVPHSILQLEWAAPSANRQARAREARYARLGSWALDHDAPLLATAHHLDDQAETILMRLDRGAGVGGLAGIRARRPLGSRGEKRVELIRPVLQWRRSELRHVAEICGAATFEDPGNADPSHDRTRARAFLSASPVWPDRMRMAASASHLSEADQALDWAAARLAAERGEFADGACLLDVTGLPAELLRRVTRELIRTVSAGSAAELRGDVLARAMEQLRQGQVATLAGVVIRPNGDRWRFEPEPPRRR